MKNRNISSKIKKSKVTDYAALIETVLMGSFYGSFNCVINLMGN